MWNSNPSFSLIIPEHEVISYRRTDSTWIYDGTFLSYYQHVEQSWYTNSIDLINQRFQKELRQIQTKTKMGLCLDWHLKTLEAHLVSTGEDQSSEL